MEMAVRWKLENDLIKFAFLVTIVVTMPSAIVGILWGVQYIGPVATVVTVLVLAFQAWYNKKTAELMKEQAEIMKQSMVLSLKKEHTAQLQQEIIEPLHNMFSHLILLSVQATTPCVLYKSLNVEIRIEIPPSLPEELSQQNSWKSLFISFVTSLNPELNMYKLYDLVEYHLSYEFIDKFKLLILSVIKNDEPEFERQLSNIREILNALRVVIVFPENCPFIEGGIRDKKKVLQLIEEVQELKKMFKILDTEKRIKFDY